MEKIQVARSRTVDCYTIDTRNLEDIIQYFTNLRGEVPSEATFYISAECFVNMEFVWTSIETDQEFERRMSMLQRAANNERKQYERLKAKFEGK